MALRDHIKEQHDKAEKHPFVVQLLSGTLSEEVYAEFLYNQAMCYYALEQAAERHGLLTGIEEIRRATLIEQDANELGKLGHVYPSTADYVRYIDSVSPRQLWGHIYCRHFGDLYGGQMIKKVAHGSCRMYDFEDRAGLIAKVRENLDDDLADEANLTLGFALRLFSELADAHNLVDSNEKSSV